MIIKVLRNNVLSSGNLHLSAAFLSADLDEALSLKMMISLPAPTPKIICITKLDNSGSVLPLVEQE